MPKDATGSTGPASAGSGRTGAAKPSPMSTTAVRIRRHLVPRTSPSARRCRCSPGRGKAATSSAFAKSLWMRGLRGFRGHAGAGVGSNGVRTRRRCQFVRHDVRRRRHGGEPGEQSGGPILAWLQANPRQWNRGLSTPPPPPPSNPPSNNPLILFIYPTQAAGTDVSGLEISIRAVAAEFKACIRPSGPTVAGTDVSRLRISQMDLFCYLIDFFLN